MSGKSTGDTPAALLAKLPITVTGARPGETLVGYRITADGSILELVESSEIVRPLKRSIDILENDGESTWQRFLKKLGGIAFFADMTLEQRAEWLRTNQMDDSKNAILARDMSSRLHPNVRLRVLQFGKKALDKIDDEALANRIITESVQNPNGLSAAEMQELIPKKPGSVKGTLLFFKDYWSVASSHSTSREYGSNDPNFVGYNIERGTLDTKYDASQKLLAYTVPIDYANKRDAVFLVAADKPSGMGEETGLDLAWRMLGKVLEGRPAPMTKQQFIDNYSRFKQDVLSAFTTAGLKSLMQKLIRFSPSESVTHPLRDDFHVMPEIALAWTMVALINSPGSFVPDIQRFVGGLESFAKRLAVIGYEDAYVGSSQIVVSLLAGALLSQRVKSWQPSNSVVASWFRFGIQSLAERRAMQFNIERGQKAKPIPMSSIATIARDTEAVKARFMAASALLDQLRSFSGDLGMVRDVALQYPKWQKAVPSKAIARPSSMPVSHAIDQHWFPDLVYALPATLVEQMSQGTSGSTPFSKVLEQVFAQVTGYNPRREPWTENRFSAQVNAFAASVRAAQEVVLRALIPRAANPQLNVYRVLPSYEQQYIVRYDLDYSWIAGLVGAIEVSVGKSRYLVTLKPSDPFELVVIPKPARGKKPESLEAITPKVEDKAKSKARDILTSAKGVPLNAIPAPFALLRGATARLVGENDDPHFEIRVPRTAKRIVQPAQVARLAPAKLQQRIESAQIRKAAALDDIRELRNRQDASPPEQQAALDQQLSALKSKLSKFEQELRTLDRKLNEALRFQPASAKRKAPDTQEQREEIDWEQARKYSGQFAMHPENSVVARDPESGLPTVEGFVRNVTEADDKRGKVLGADAALAKLVESTPKEHVRRALGVLSGYRYSIQMPRISRDGGGTEVAVQVADVGAFQFLAALAQLYPLALSKRSKSLVAFDVTFAPALWALRDAIVELASLGGVDAWLDSRAEQWGAETHTPPRRPVGRTPWPHQEESTREMLAKRSKGNFIWIPTGMGKTAIVLEYIIGKLERNELPPYVLYVLPGPAVPTIASEAAAYNFNVDMLWPLKGNANDTEYAPAKIVPGCQPRKYRITLVRQDDVRRCPDLVGYAPNALLIYDEVHLAMAGATQRTQGALALSRASDDFVALTATPIIDNSIFTLIPWVEQIVEFPVTELNIFAAVNSMVAKKVTTGVHVERERIKAALSAQETQRSNDLLPVAFGGKNPYASVEDLLEANRIAYQAVSRVMVEKTLEQLKFGGVMLVALNKSHQQLLLDKLLAKGLKRSDIFLIGPDGAIYLTDKSVRDERVRDYRIVITTKDRAEGYSLTRLKSMIQGVYPANQAKRTQMDGRIDRIDQVGIDPVYDPKTKALKKKGRIYSITVYAGPLQEVLLERHLTSKNLEQAMLSIAKDIGTDLRYQ